MFQLQVGISLTQPPIQLIQMPRRSRLSWIYNRTCAVDNSSVLCSECFFASDHTGHDVTLGVAYSFSGYCDCGDPTSWSNPTTCPNHPPANEPTDPSSSNITKPPPSVELPRDRDKAIANLLELVLDYIVETFESGPPEGNATVPRSVEEVIVETQGPPVPGVAQKIELVSLILWSDEKHTAKEIARQIANATGMSKAEAKDLVDILDKQVGKLKPEPKQRATDSVLTLQIFSGTSCH